MTNESSLPLDQQILAISKLAGQIRNSLQTVRASLPSDTLEKLSNLESLLFQASKQVNAVEEERRKLLALANTTQAVNSSSNLTKYCSWSWIPLSA